MPSLAQLLPPSALLPGMQQLLWRLPDSTGSGVAHLMSLSTAASSTVRPCSCSEVLACCRPGSDHCSDPLHAAEPCSVAQHICAIEQHDGSKILTASCPVPPNAACHLAACASARRLEEAAQLYGEFATQPRAHRQGQSAHAAMIAACSEATQALSTKDRRGRLVLLQRAMRVADDIRAAGQEPSLEVLHALAVAAGHAGQVQQALQICREMQVGSTLVQLL